MDLVADAHLIPARRGLTCSQCPTVAVMEVVVGLRGVGRYRFCPKHAERAMAEVYADLVASARMGRKKEVASG